MIQVAIDPSAKGRVTIGFPYNPALVAAVKTLPGRQWLPDRKVWSIPRCFLDRALALFNGQQVYVSDAVRKAPKEEEATRDLSRAGDVDIEVPAPPGLALLPFQKAAVAFIERTGGRTLLGDEPGVGKTVEALGWLNMRPELRPVVVVTPASVKLTWEYEINRWSVHPERVVVLSGREPDPALVEGASFIVSNYDILSQQRRRIERAEAQAILDAKCRCRERDEWKRVIPDKEATNPKRHKPRCPARKALRDAAEPLRGWADTLLPRVLVLDECFPYETEVETSIGPIAIGLIVEQGLEVMVLSWNQRQQRLEWKRIERYIKRLLSEPLVRVIHEAGSFCCTGSHKVWTEEEGYVLARALTSAHHLRMVWDPGGETQAREINGAVLLPRLREQLAHEQTGDEGRSIACQRETSSEKDLRVVQEGVLHAIGRQGERREEVLRSLMLCELENEPALGQGELQESGESDLGMQSRAQVPSLLRAYASSESYVQPGDSGEGSDCEYRTNVPLQRGEWEAHEASVASGRTPWPSDGASDSHLSSQDALYIPPQQLQGGLGGSAKETGDRSGWPFPQHQALEVPRQTQDRRAHRSRVVRVEVLQRGGSREHGSGSGGDQAVYDLEIAGNHNYFAKGVLVSNCHALKGGGNLRTRAALKLASKAAHVIGATGTALLNRPIELFPQLRAIRPDLFGDWWDFATRYANLHKRRVPIRKDDARRTPEPGDDGEGGDGFVTVCDTSGASRLAELERIMRSNLLIRRLKREVMSELPPKRRVSVLLESERSEDYDRIEEEVRAKAREYRRTREALNQKVMDLPPEARKDFLARSAEAHATFRLRGVLFTEVSKLRQETGRMKYPAGLDWVRTWLEGSEDQKLLLFIHHRDIQERFFADLGRWNPIQITGGMSAQARKRAQDRFQTDPKVRVAVLSLLAASEGITLTAASNLVIYEWWWNPAKGMEQPEGRADRIGQTMPVTVYYLLAKDTLDPQIAEMIEAKRHVVAAALGDVEQALSDQGILESLTDALLDAPGGSR